MEIQEAINTVVRFNTLPPQIDYIGPYKIKAMCAQEFIDSLPEKQKDAANAAIERVTEEYYNSPVSYYDTLF